jgi:hypothetical protein
MVAITYNTPVQDSLEYRNYVGDFMQKVSGNLRLLSRPEKRIRIRGTPVVEFQLQKEGMT